MRADYATDRPMVGVGVGALHQARTLFTPERCPDLSTAVLAG